MTPQQKDAAMLAWAEYMRAGGGAGASLTTEMYEALNDHAVRDAFLFWQVGGSTGYIQSKGEFTPEHAAELDRLHALAGEAPGKTSATDALAVALNRLPRANELVNSGTVLVLASVLWDLLDSRYTEAAAVMTELIGLNLQYTKGKPMHYDPMHAFGEACRTLPKMDPLEAHDLILKVFGVTEYSVSEVSPPRNV